MDDILAILANYVPKEEVMQTVADQIRAESRSVFVQEGEKKGEMKGVRSTILDQMLASSTISPWDSARNSTPSKALAPSRAFPSA